MYLYQESEGIIFCFSYLNYWIQVYISTKGSFIYLYATFSKKSLFLYVRVRIRGWEMVVFWKSLCVQTKWMTPNLFDMYMFQVFNASSIAIFTPF